jgi:hypothetical protein
MAELLDGSNNTTLCCNREIFAALKVGEFAFFQLAVDKIPRLLQKLNG